MTMDSDRIYTDLVKAAFDFKRELKTADYSKGTPRFALELNGPVGQAKLALMKFEHDFPELKLYESNGNKIFYSMGKIYVYLLENK